MTDAEQEKRGGSGSAIRAVAYIVACLVGLATVTLYQRQAKLERRPLAVAGPMDSATQNGDLLELTYKLTNQTNKPVVVNRFLPNCVCLSCPDLPLEIPAQGNTKLEIILDRNKTTQVKFSGSMLLYVVGQPEAVAYVPVNALLRDTPEKGED